MRGLSGGIISLLMTWIKTIPLSEANEKLLHSLESQRALYPKEYATPVFKTDDGVAGIVASHSLIPDALHIRRADVPGITADSPAARDDHHHGFGDQPLFLLNRVACRVSA